MSETPSRGGQGAAATNRVRFTVVVPTYQRREVVRKSVLALADQEGAAAFEVIVVVDGSTDGTADVLRELVTPFRLEIVEQANSGLAAARNRGAAAASGELLLFLDDDMEAHPRLLAEHDRSHREGADVVLGHVPLHPDSPPNFLSAAVGAWAENRARLLSERDDSIGLNDLLGGQMSLRRDVFVRLGGFDTTFNRHGTFGGEDLDLGRRLVAGGYRIVFNPDAISWQRYVVTPRQYLRQWRDAGRARVLLARKHPDQAEMIFYRRQRPSDRIFWRWLRVPLRELILLLPAPRSFGARLARWFFRVTELEHFAGVRAAGGRPARRPVRVLCYHSISDFAGARVYEPYGVPPSEFRRQLRVLDRHFRVLSADEFERFLQGFGVPTRAVVLTFDDCFDDLLDTAVPLLRERSIPALAFAVTRRLGATNDWDTAIGAPAVRLLDADGLRAVTSAGVALGTHTRTHRMLTRLPPAEVADEVRGSVSDLEQLGFGRPSFLAYPHGEHDADVRREVAAAGLQAAFAVTPGLARPGNDPFTIPRIEILRADAGWRFVWKVFSAGRFDRDGAETRTRISNGIRRGRSTIRRFVVRRPNS